MGDFLHQHIIVDPGPDRAAKADRPDYADYSIYSGGFLFEKLSEWCFECKYLKSLKTGLTPVEYRQKLADAKERVNGPSRGAQAPPVLTDPEEVDDYERKRKENIFNLSKKEHITLQSLGGRVSYADFKAPRIHRRLGQSDAGEGTNVDGKNARTIDGFEGTLLLSVDFNSFLKLEFKEYCESSGGKKKSKINAKAIVVRMTIPPTVDLSDDHVLRIDENLGAFLKKQRGSAGGKRIIVVSSETLRTMGHDISYRKAWERTISDVVRSLRSLRAVTPGKMPGCFAEADWVVVTFYNDAALAVPLAPQPDDEVLFVGEPGSIERDLHLSFDAHTRGTETLVTQAIATQITLAEQADVEKALRKGLVHGLKASRFLQIHGYTGVKLGGEWSKYSTGESPTSDLAETLVKEGTADDPQGKLNYDVMMYLWNRSRSADYFEFQNKLLLHPNQKGAKVPTWPFGDVVEILVNGEPFHGSFPPIAVEESEERARLQKSTRRTSLAYDRAGWMEIAKIPVRTILGGHDLATTDPGTDSAITHWGLRTPLHDESWWSFEELVLDNLYKAVRLCDDEYDGDEERDKSLRDFARHLLGFTIVKFGDEGVNRKGLDPKEWFGLRLAAVLLSDCGPAFKGPHREIFVRLKREKILDHLTPLNSSGLAGTSATDEGKLLRIIGMKEKDRKPLCARVLRLLQEVSARRSDRVDLSYASGVAGPLPFLRVGKLTATSRREIQALRDIKERITGYENAKRREGPLNLAVFGPPGSGKSFGVKQILTQQFGEDKVEFLEFNLAGVTAPATLASYFLRIQESSLRGKTPVAFWDEYDTTLGITKLGWLASFLDPMQSGQFSFEGTLRQLPPCYFVFAGSMFQSFGEMLVLNALAARPSKAQDLDYLLENHAGAPIGSGEDDGWLEVLRSSRLGKFSTEEWEVAKGRDFLSRLDGNLDVSGIAPRRPFLFKSSDQSVKSELHLSLLSKDSDLSPFLRKARLIRTQLRLQTDQPELATAELTVVDSVLADMLEEEHFIHGMRGIEKSIAQFAYRGRPVIDASVVPTGDQRRMHMSARAFDRERDA